MNSLLKVSFNIVLSFVSVITVLTITVIMIALPPILYFNHKTVLSSEDMRQSSIPDEALTTVHIPSTE